MYIYKMKQLVIWRLNMYNRSMTSKAMLSGEENQLFKVTTER